MNRLHNDWLNNNNKSLERTFNFSGYLKTMSFANAIAWEANRQNHHPDMYITYNSCKVIITTHSKGNTVTEQDYQLAIAIDTLHTDR